MASIVLGALGTTLGASAISGTILGLTGGAIGGMIGSAVGSMVDSWIVAQLQPTQRMEGPRLDSVRVTSSTEGAVLPRVHGRMRIGGNIIWATDFREEIVTTRSGGGKSMGGPKVETTEYLYYASLAVALCEGEISGIGRVWADGKPMDMTGVTWRIYRGDEAQEPDPFIAAKMGAETPAYRGTAYVVFEELPLEKFGNRLPQFSFEVFRALADEDAAEGMVRAVTLIPASGEFTYATTPVRRTEQTGGGGSGGWGSTFGSSADTEAASENINAIQGVTDIVVALDRLQAMCPAVESVSLVVSWFGNDLRAGECLIRPGVEVPQKNTGSVTWSVNGVSRAGAHLVTQVEGRPVYGGTPADFSIVEAIQEIKARGLRVTFYPFILMDVPEGNSLPNPYSDNAAESGQPVFPWRGRITCSPAPGYAGSPDKSGAGGAQINAFFGSAAPSDFSVSGTTVSWTGGADWGFRRMILHYAHLCAAAGGVDAFLIGSEMRGVTQVRSSGSFHTAVARLETLAEDVRSIVGSGTKLSYAADWSEYFGHQPGDGSGDVFFHLDRLWASSAIDFVGIDNYMPLSDWRDGFGHLDAEAAPAIYDRDYLQGNIEGGEGFDWFYASDADRFAQLRTPITDGAAGKPWVYRYKALRDWWANQHFNRPGGVESASPTDWVPQSKPIWFTEFGCPAVDRGTNQPNVFFDPKSSESFVPHFSRGWRDDTIQRAYLEATIDYWRRPENNPQSSVYSGRMIHLPEAAAWTWDARPYPWFPERTEVWADGENWRLGHWLNGRLGAVQLGALVRELCGRAGLPLEKIDTSQLWGAVEGYLITALESPRVSISVLARYFGFDAAEVGGKIVFRMRGRAPVGSVTLDEMLPNGPANAEVIEITRAQETELPQSLKWQLARSDEDYDPAVVEARRTTVQAARIAQEGFPLAVPPEEAERHCRRALFEAWVGRETAAFRLPPSRLAYDPGDVLILEHDGREIDMRILQTTDGEARSIEAVFVDREVHELPPGSPRSTTLPVPVVFSPSAVQMMNLPQLQDDIPAHLPYIAVHTKPWPGSMSVYRSATLDGFERQDVINRRGKIGVLIEPLAAGPVARFDRGNDLVVEFATGELQSVTDRALFAGANAMAIEASPGVWEIVQAGTAELIAPRRYRLSRLLRGQRGTEWAMAASVAPGAGVVLLDSSVVGLAIWPTDIGQEWNWRVGPSTLPPSDEVYVAGTFTPTGEGLRPFSVAHVEQPGRRGREPGDLTIRWKRRDRALVADVWEPREVPMLEESEQYEVDILDGGTVLRTLTATGPSVVYSGAQQSSDWGAALGPGDSLTIRVAQLSQAFIGDGPEWGGGGDGGSVGRGTVRTVTLKF